MPSVLSRGLLLGLPAAALISACGGGGGAPPAAPQAAPSAVPVAAAVDTPPATAPVTPPLAGDGTPMPLVETHVPDALPEAAPDVPPAPLPAVGDAERIAAATATAASSTNACAAIRPFYWEIGRAGGRVAGGSVATGSARYEATTPMAVASASKWLYGAYVAQRQGGALSDDDRRFLTLRSGYVSFRGCQSGQTVDQCLAARGNGDYTAAMDGRFYYGGGHMERHASQSGLGGLDAAGLAAEVRGQLGTDLPLTYTEAQPAGGAVTSADGYARVLRRMLDGTLQMGALLGSGAVCTQSSRCPAGEAVYAPVPANLSWHYAVGHWVEDDPVAGDGAFSSPGAFGFYPWIDAGRSTYGVVARVAANGAWPSVRCGQLIRKAWFSGAAQ